MMGETPTTVLAATAARMPGTARMVPMLTTGFDGGNTITSASPMASSTPGAGAASAAPTAMMAAAGVCACMRTHHSWKCTVRWLVQHDVRLDGVIGHRQQPHSGLPALAEHSVTADSGWPEASSWLRRMWVPKSRSPSVNQSGLAP